MAAAASRPARASIPVRAFPHSIAALLTCFLAAAARSAAAIALGITLPLFAISSAAVGLFSPFPYCCQAHRARCQAIFLYRRRHLQQQASSSDDANEGTALVPVIRGVQAGDGSEATVVAVSNGVTVNSTSGESSSFLSSPAVSITNYSSTSS